MDTVIRVSCSQHNYEHKPTIQLNGYRYSLYAPHKYTHLCGQAYNHTHTLKPTSIPWSFKSSGVMYLQLTHPLVIKHLNEQITSFPIWKFHYHSHNWIPNLITFPGLNSRWFQGECRRCLGSLRLADPPLLPWRLGTKEKHTDPHTAYMTWVHSCDFKSKIFLFFLRQLGSPLHPGIVFFLY